MRLHATTLPSQAARDPGLDAAVAPCHGAGAAPELLDWRGFHSELQRAAIEATQTGAPLSLLMLALAESDRIGERLGSAPSLRIGGLAGVVGAAVAERGRVARYAAEWLAAILIDVDLEAAIARAQSIARAAVALDPESAPTIGIAQFRDDESLGHLIQRTTDAVRRAQLAPGPVVVADRGARQRPVHALGLAPPPAPAYALKDERER